MFPNVYDVSVFMDSNAFSQIANTWSLPIQISDLLIQAFVQWDLLIDVCVPGRDHSEQSNMVSDFIKFKI